MFEWSFGLSEKERAVKNILNILNTREGDVAFDRGLGMSQNYIDKRISDLSSEVITEIDDMIAQREPRIKLEIESLESLSEEAILEVLLSDES